MTLTAIDLFAGAGGATEGLKRAGFNVLGAVEFDHEAARSFKLNHPMVAVWEDDIRKVSATEVRRDLGLRIGELTLLKACPPCQGFSTLAGNRVPTNDPRNELVKHTIRFVRELRPAAVLLENVPGLARDQRAKDTMEAMRGLGYAVKSYVVNAVDFGVPQKRRRLIILALRGLRSKLPESLTPTDPEVPTSVREAFSTLMREVDSDDPLNQYVESGEKVMRRIRAVPVGGNRYDLPPHLQLDCHVRLDKGNGGASGSYGRMKWDSPSPTMTTRCTTPACGPFIHPDEDRAITLREAASLQTFPHNYQFSGGRTSVERQIGNAVPVLLASRIGQQVIAKLS